MVCDPLPATQRVHRVGAKFAPLGIAMREI
jgi:hypothetical protein